MHKVPQEQTLMKLVPQRHNYFDDGVLITHTHANEACVYDGHAATSRRGFCDTVTSDSELRRHADQCISVCNQQQIPHCRFMYENSNDKSAREHNEAEVLREVLPKCQRANGSNDSHSHEKSILNSRYRRDAFIDQNVIGQDAQRDNTVNVSATKRRTLPQIRQHAEQRYNDDVTRTENYSDHQRVGQKFMQAKKLAQKQQIGDQGNRCEPQVSFPTQRRRYNDVDETDMLSV